jgi:hypothetical protein
VQGPSRLFGDLEIRRHVERQLNALLPDVKFLLHDDSISFSVVNAPADEGDRAAEEETHA